MNLNETAALLALIVSLDGRQLTEMSLDAWHAVLEPVDPEHAKAAVLEHYRTQTTRIMPAHIVASVRAKRQRAISNNDRVLALEAGGRQAVTDPVRLGELVESCREAIVGRGGAS